MILTSHDKHSLKRFGLKLLMQAEDVNFLGSARLLKKERQGAV